MEKSEAMTRNPEHLHSVVRELLAEHQAMISRRLGLTTTCIETWRDAASQNTHKAAGLSEKAAGSSWHNITLPDGTPASFAYHLSIDPAGPLMIGFGTSNLHPLRCATAKVDMGRHGMKYLSSEELLYLAIGLIAEELGLVWGGRWDVAGRGPDWTHFEYRGAASPSDMAALLALGTIINKPVIA